MSLGERDSFDWFTKIEGGNYDFSLKGVSIPSNRYLDLHRKSAFDDKRNTIGIWGFDIHSFGTINGRRWDIVNGWTK